MGGGGGARHLIYQHTAQGLPFMTDGIKRRQESKVGAGRGGDEMAGYVVPTEFFFFFTISPVKETSF